MPTVEELITLGRVLDIITDVLLSLSLFGCVATVLTFVVFNEMRTYPIKLIVYLCVTIFLAQLFFWLSFGEPIYSGIMCVPTAMILHYFFLASFLWTFCVAFNFYQMIVRRNRDAETLEKIYHLVCWLVPLIVCVVMVATKSYGRPLVVDSVTKSITLGDNCYMLEPLAVFLGFFLPGLIIVSANAVIFFFIAREIHDTLKSAPKADKKEKSKEFKVYFSIFVSIGLSWFFGFIMVFLDDVARIIFLILYSVLTPLQGFLIFVSYCFNAKVASKWAGLIGRVIPLFRRWENLGSTTATSSTSGSSGSQRTSGTTNSSKTNSRTSHSTHSSSYSENNSNSI